MRRSAMPREGVSIARNVGDLTVRYADVAAQWRRLPGPDGRPSAYGPGWFQFTGGDVILDLRIGLFLVSYVEPKPGDDLSVKIFAAHYGHELLHVLDETDT